MMKKEPFLPRESVMIIESWTSLHRNVVAGITTRDGGVSKEPYHSMNLGLHVHDNLDDLIRNRKILGDIIEAALRTWICGEQIHGDKIVKVTQKDMGKGSLQMETAIKGVDGLYTNERNIFLMAAYADCVPLYFFSKTQNVIGVAHAGWRGTVANIAGKMIDKWTKDENISIQDIFVCIGPSVGKCCYIVDNHVIDQLANCLDDKSICNVYDSVADGKYSLDLKQANFELLKNAGVLLDHIEVSNYCTSCNPNLFFSYRRDQGKTGRMLSFIGLKDA